MVKSYNDELLNETIELLQKNGFIVNSYNNEEIVLQNQYVQINIFDLRQKNE